MILEILFDTVSLYLDLLFFFVFYKIFLELRALLLILSFQLFVKRASGEKVRLQTSTCERNLFTIGHTCAMFF